MEKQTIRFSPMIVSVVFTLFSLFSILTICPNTVFAAAPAGVTVENAAAVVSYVLANGNAITLKAADSDPSKTLIYLDSDPTNPVELTGLEAKGNTTDGYDLSKTMIFGGAYRTEVASSKVTMEGGSVKGIYGGGSASGISGDNVIVAVNGTATIIMSGGSVLDTIYGGGNGGTTTCENTTIIMDGGSVRYLNGGSVKGTVANATITMSGGTVRYLYGGGGEGTVTGDTRITMSGGNVTDWIYGSGNGTINGNTYVTLTGGTVNGSAYAGGNGIVKGNTNLTISGGTFNDNIYGGGSSNVDGNATVTISGGTFAKNIYGGGIGDPYAPTLTVAGAAIVKIGVDASITGTVSEKGLTSTSNVGAGSHVEYEVAFYDGTTKLASPAPQWITAGSTAVQPASNPVSPGKAFNGWNKADNSAFDFSAAITAAAKVYADWTSLPTYAVTYNGNGNTGGTVPTDSNTYAAGANVPLAGNTGNLTKTGYTFGGWSTTANGTAVTTYTMGSAPVTFYAVWKTTPADNGNNNNSGNNNSSSTTTTSRAPSLETGGGQTIVGALEAAKSGTTVEVNMNDSTMLQGDWMKAIAGKDVNLVLDMGGGVKWTINGKNVSGTSFSSVNLGVSTNTSRIPGSVVNKVSGERKTVQFTITHNGSFGFTAALSVGLGKENKGLFANLYYYNETTQKMEFQSASKIGEDGSAAWEFKHASSYAVVIDKASHATELSAGAGIEDTAMALNTVNNQ